MPVGDVFADDVIKWLFFVWLVEYFNALFEFTNKLVEFWAQIDYLDVIIDQLLIKIDLFVFSHASTDSEKVSFLTDVIIYI